MAGFAQLADALSDVIMSDRNLSRESKEDFLRKLASWPVIVDNVAQRQSKLRRSKNGQAVEEDGMKAEPLTETTALRRDARE
jgi:hypothetical protein